MRRNSGAWLAIVLLALSAKGAPVENLLTGGDFNQPDGTSMDETGWSAWWGEPQPVTRETWADRGGNGRGVVVNGALAGNLVGFYQTVTATPGVTYVFSVWAKKEKHYNEVNTHLKIEWLDSGQQPVDEAAPVFITGKTGPTYKQFAVSGSTTNPLCCYARAVVYAEWATSASTISAGLHFDDASLVAEKKP